MLSEPELDIMLEMVAAEPACDEVLTVVRALMGRERKREALATLQNALDAGFADPEADRLLSQILQPRKRFSAHQVQGPEPLLSSQRADAYARAGRTDLALQMYRLLDQHLPGDAYIQSQISALEFLPTTSIPVVDDLSVEVPASVARPAIRLPTTSLQPSAFDDRMTPRQAVQRTVAPVLEDIEDWEDEETEPVVRRGPTAPMPGAVEVAAAIEDDRAATDSNG